MRPRQSRPPTRSCRGGRLERVAGDQGRRQSGEERGLDEQDQHGLRADADVVRRTGARGAEKEARRVPGDAGGLATWKSFGPATTAFLDDQGVAPGPTRANAAPAARRTSNQGGDAVEVVWKVYEDGSQGARQSAAEESATEEAGFPRRTSRRRICPITGPAPAAAKKRGLFSKGRAAQPKPVVDESRPSPRRRRYSADDACSAPAPGAGAGTRRGAACSRHSWAPRSWRRASRNSRRRPARPEPPTRRTPRTRPPTRRKSVYATTTRLREGPRGPFWDGPWTSSKARALVARDDAAAVALTEAQEDALRKVFNRVDISGDGHISVIEAIKRSAARGVRRPSRPTSRGCWASTT